MSKFYGAIGYSVAEEIRPGVWGEKITVRDYYGDVIRNTRQYQSSDNLNDNLNVSNEFSIVADPFAYANFHSMRFIEYMGAKWKISNVEVKYPRLILTVGGVYNEQTTETAECFMRHPLVSKQRTRVSCLFSTTVIGKNEIPRHRLRSRRYREYVCE